MPNYDIGHGYDTAIGLNMVDLCKELMEEENLGVDVTEEYFRDKFNNYDRSGLVNKLEGKLNFRIDDFLVSGDVREKHAKLKLLKELYYIEKSGDPKKSKSKKEDTRICITDILAKPRLDNISDGTTPKSEYGEIFDKLLSGVKKEITDTETKKKQLEGLNAYWEYITRISFDYVTTDRALDDPEDAMQELKRIERFLKEKVLGKLPQESDRPKLTYKETMMETFYNILLSHRLLCNEADRLNINYQICMEDVPNEEYIQCFRKYDNWMARWEMIPALRQRLSKDINNPGADIAILLIIGEYDAEDHKADYEFALEHVKTLLGWIEKNKKADFNEQYPLLVLVACIQEIVFVKQTDERFKNDFYGNKYTAKPLLATLKKPQKADAVMIKAWIKKVENRLAVNFGAMGTLKKKREVENLIYQIKQYVYSHQNFDELVFVNDLLVHFAARSMISRDFAMQIGNRFAQKVAKSLNKDIRELKVFLGPGGANVYDMFRAFSLKEETEDEVAAAVANYINAFYTEDSGVIVKRSWHEFCLHYSSAYDRKFMYEFMIDRTTNQFEHLQFYEVVSDEEVAEIKRLGLEKFVLT